MENQTIPPTFETAPDSSGRLLSKRNILVFLGCLLILGSIPATVLLVQRSQILKSRAAVDVSQFISFSDASCSGFSCTASKTDITMTLKPPPNEPGIWEEVPATPTPIQSGPTLTPPPTPIQSGPTPTATPTPIQSGPTPTPARPAPPTGLSHTCLSSSQVKLFWDSVPGASDYWYWVSSFVGSYQQTSDNFAIVNITLGVTYQWRVAIKGSSDYTEGSPFQCGS